MTGKLVLKSFTVTKNWGGAPFTYSASIEYEDDYGNGQRLKMTAEQAAKVLDAALEQIVEASKAQAQLLADTAGAHLAAVVAEQQAKAITHIDDAEVA